MAIIPGPVLIKQNDPHPLISSMTDYYQDYFNKIGLLSYLRNKYDVIIKDIFDTGKEIQLLFSYEDDYFSNDYDIIDKYIVKNINNDKIINKYIEVIVENNKNYSPFIRFIINKEKLDSFSIYCKLLFKK